MKIRHSDIIIDENEPFKNCKLNRESYAHVLTNIIEVADSGFVLALNNEWGHGKSTFVKMWKRSLEIKGYETLYFNAWEADINDEPLVAILAEIKELTKEEDIPTFKKVVKHGSSIVKRILPDITKLVVENI